MNDYHVCWKIDISAESPEEAARIARKYQLDPDTHADHFEVFDEDGNATTVNISELEDETDQHQTTP